MHKAPSTGNAAYLSPAHYENDKARSGLHVLHIVYIRQQKNDWNAENSSSIRNGAAMAIEKASTGDISVRSFAHGGGLWRPR